MYLLETVAYLTTERLKHISKIRRLQNGQPEAILTRYQELTGKTDEEVESVFNNPLINFFLIFD